MDSTHLTEAGQLIVADYIYSLLVAPSEISFLAESAIQTTFGTITGIQQQIDLSQRRQPAGTSGSTASSPTSSSITASLDFRTILGFLSQARWASTIKWRTVGSSVPQSR